MHNYHTHIYRCKHAVGTVNDYVEAAIKDGFTILGFSDHTPLPDGNWLDYRMSMKELPLYFEELKFAKEKYTDICILKGLECEHSPEYLNFYKEVLIDQYEADYLVGGLHYIKMAGDWICVYGGIRDRKTLHVYTDMLIDAMQSGLYAFIAHPDLFANSYLSWDTEAVVCSREICCAAKALNIPLEMNGYGFAKPKIHTPEGDRYMYPWKPFWEVASDYDIPVVISADCHSPETLKSNYTNALLFHEKYPLPIARPVILD